MLTKFFYNEITNDIEYIRKFNENWHRVYDFQNGTFLIKNMHPITAINLYYMKELVVYED